MVQMKRGFTLIELIFVIVIVSILAAFSLPKFMNTAEQAQVAKFKSYAGTLTRTTLPPFWSKSIDAELNGAIASYDGNITNALKPPVELGTVSFASGNLENTAFLFENAPSHGIGSATIDGVTYTVACSEGSLTESPKCNVWDGTRWLIKY